MFETPVAELPGLGWTPKIDSRFAVRTLGDAARRLHLHGRESRRQAELVRIQLCDQPVTAEMSKIIEEISGAEPDFKLMQIGAHNGSFDDPFVERIEEQAWSAILVEPQVRPFEELAARHAANPDVECVHAAIGAAAGSMTLWRADLQEQPEFGSAIASTKPDQVRREVRRCLGSSAARSVQLVKEEVPVITLDELFDRTSTAPDSIGLFATDTEGYDAHIVRSLISDYQVRPPIIQWEHLHVDAAETAQLNSGLGQIGYNVLQTHKDTLAYM